MRLALLAEGTTPEVLSFLVTDLDPIVRLVATDRLGRPGAAEPVR